MNECRCDFRTRLVGDGCSVCNPKLAQEIDQENEIETLRTENAKMLDLLRIVRAMPHSHEAIRKVVQYVDSLNGGVK